MNQGDMTSVLPGSFGSGGVPDVGQNVAIGEGHEHLRGLIVGGGEADVAAGGKLSHLPAPGEQWILIEVHIHSALERERGLAALESQNTIVPLADDGEVRRAAMYLELPAIGQAARRRRRGI